MPQVAEQQSVSFCRNGLPVNDRAQWIMSGLVYYDGSCFRAPDAEMSRATFSVVEVDREGALVASYRATVPRQLPQTSQAAEQCGRQAAVQLARAITTLHGDCRVVVEAANSPERIAASPRRL